MVKMEMFIGFFDDVVELAPDELLDELVDFSPPQDVKVNIEEHARRPAKNTETAFFIKKPPRYQCIKL